MSVKVRVTQDVVKVIKVKEVGAQGIVGGGGAWGGITGTLSDQTDLQGELDGKLGTAHNTSPTAHTTEFAAKLSHTAGTLTDYKETTNYVTTSGNVTIDLADGNVQRFILDAARQFTLPADPGAVTESFVLIIEPATFTPTWNSSPTIEWLTSDGAAPTLVTTANLVNVLTFIWDDVDSRWLGFLAGKETA